MSNKATHKGTCQFCSAVQKLPGDVLAKHGYSVDYGFFNGTCPGSGNLPYEKSSELIEASIIKATNNIKALMVEIYYWFNESTPDNKMAMVEIRTGRITTFQKCVITQKPGEWCFATPAIDAPPLKIRMPGNPEGVAKALNDIYCHHLRNKVAKIEQYIDHQQKRIEKWEEKPLLIL